MRQFSIIFLLLCFFLNFNMSAQQITIENNKLMRNGQAFFMIGANTPWDNWNDFGGNYNPDFWEKEFARMHAIGINSSRIWISCDGAGQPSFDTLGNILPPTQAFWNNMDDMMAKAQKHQIYIIATIMSFDHFDQSKPNNEKWRAMIGCTQKINTYIDLFLVPLVNRYKTNPYLFSIDICNEPDWIFENKKCGHLPWEYLQMFGGMCAAAIHKTDSNVLVSVGSAYVKYNSSKYEGNKWSDKNLQEITGDSLAYMDFWHIHYYDWVKTFFNSPFLESPTFFDLTDKPCIIGEAPGRNTKYGFPITYLEIYEKPYQLGYSGVYPWTSNNAGSGDFGSLDTFGEGAKEFSIKYPQFIIK